MGNYTLLSHPSSSSWFLPTAGILQAFDHHRLSLHNYMHAPFSHHHHRTIEPWCGCSDKRPRGTRQHNAGGDPTRRKMKLAASSSQRHLDNSWSLIPTNPSSTHIHTHIYIYTPCWCHPSEGGRWDRGDKEEQAIYNISAWSGIPGSRCTSGLLRRLNICSVV